MPAAAKAVRVVMLRSPFLLVGVVPYEKWSYIACSCQMTVFLIIEVHLFSFEMAPTWRLSKVSFGYLSLAIQIRATVEGQGFHSGFHDVRAQDSGAPQF